MNSKIFSFLCVCSVTFLNACSEKQTSTDIPVAEATSSVRYLGLRLLDVPTSTGPFSLEKEFKECIFKKDDIDWPISTEECKIKDLAPTFKERPDENVNIDSIVTRSGPVTATISPNQSTYENTLRIFDNLVGVEKKSFECKNIETDGGMSEFFIIAKNGVDKFSIQEYTYGGSGGSQTTTTVFFNMVTPDCNEIARLDKMILDQTREKNLSVANNSKEKASNNILYDEKTGLSLSEDSKNYKIGGCTGILAVKINEGELKAEDNSDEKNAWIRSQAKRGADLMAKFKASPEGTSLFDMVNSGEFTKGEAEFMAGYLTYLGGAQKSSRLDRSLAAMSICGEAGYQKPL